MNWLRDILRRWLIDAPAPALPPRQMQISQNALATAMMSRRPEGRVVTQNDVVAPYKPLPRVLPSGMAMDEACPPSVAMANTWALQDLWSEGLMFIGYPTLAALSQRAEYRHGAEIWAEHATRKWVKLRGPDDKTKLLRAFLGDGTDPEAKTEEERKKVIVDNSLNVAAVFREALGQDGIFGRSQIFLDFDDFDNDVELEAPLVVDPKKISPTRPLKRLKVVEPMWIYPAPYGTSNPLAPDFYKPDSWYVYGRPIHATRLLTIIGQEVPDILKPAYAFGGMSRTQMAKPYVDNWLRARQSASDLLHSFSIITLATEMEQVLFVEGSPGAQSLFDRAALFTQLRDNMGLNLINKGGEEMDSIAVPLSGVADLVNQAFEQVAGAYRIPLSIYNQITPSGLNASSDGETRNFYADVGAYQEKTCRQPFHKILDVAQLSLFGAIDPAITFEFVALWEMSDKDKAQIRKDDATADQTYTTLGAIDADDVRNRLNMDESSAYYGQLEGAAPGPELPEDDTGALGGNTPSKKD
jgi:phage-related protein (TIGR01555 family)